MYIINKDWNIEKANKHYLEQLMYAFGHNKPSFEEKQKFNHEYWIKYPDNWIAIIGSEIDNFPLSKITLKK